MADATKPQYSGFDLSGAASLANLFMGKVGTTQNSGGTSTSGTKTTTESVDPAAVSATVKSILEGTQGLASVASGQKKAGLYNSSTNTLMVNDLIARTAAEASKLNKTTTSGVSEATVDSKATTTTQKPTLNTQPTQMAGMLLGSLSLIPAETRKAMLAKLGIGDQNANTVNTLGNNATVDPMGATDSLTRRGDILGSNAEQSIAPSTTVTNVGSYDLSPDIEATRPSAVVPDAGVDGSDMVTGSMDAVTGTGDDLAGFAGDASSGVDLSGAADVGAGAIDAGDVAGNVIQDTGSDLLGDVSEFFFADGGLVSSSNLGKNVAQSNSKGMTRKHYATGGIVNTGLRQVEQTDDAYDMLSPVSNVSSAVGSVAKAATGASTPATSSTKTSTPTTKAASPTPDIGSAGSSSNGTDSTANSGPFGSIGGLAGMAGMAVGMISGIPGLGLAAQAVANAVSGSSSNGVASADAVGGMSAPGSLGSAVSTTADMGVSPIGTTSPTAADTAAALGLGNESSPTPDSPADDGANSNGDPAGGPAGDAPGASDAGSAPGDSGSAGDAGSAGGDAYSKGGDVNGEGDETSDSIPIHVSNGEYVLNAEATKMFFPIIEHMNNMGKAKMARTTNAVGQVRRPNA